MKRALVTGGGGFIGSHLAEGLLDRGWQVRVLDDFSTGNPVNLAPFQDKIDLIRASMLDRNVVARAVEGCDTVFHLAALPSVIKSVEEPLVSHELCDTGVLRVLDAARLAGVRRFVYAASSSAYGDQPGDVRRETDQLIPLSPYAAGKLAGEHFCQAYTTSYGFETVRLRFFNVFGPRQDAKSPYSGVIALFIAAMKAGKTPTIFGDGLQARDFVYVANVVEAMVLASESKAAVGRVYNVGMGQSTTVLELVNILNRLLGTQIVPRHEPARAGDVKFSQADVSAAQADLGYRPAISFADGLAKTLAG